MTETASKRSAVRIAAIQATPSTPRPRSRRPVGETAVSYPNADRVARVFPRSSLASRASELAGAARLLLRTASDHPRAGRDETTALLAKGNPRRAPQMSAV
jgi:hypothetical protein